MPPLDTSSQRTTPGCSQQVRQMNPTSDIEHPRPHTGTRSTSPPTASDISQPPPGRQNKDWSEQKGDYGAEFPPFPLAAS